MDNTGETLHVSCKKFYNEATDCNKIADNNIKRIKLIAANEIRANHTGIFAITTKKWRKGAAEKPNNWRGIYRGYEYFITGRVNGNNLSLMVTVFKQYNFDPGEKYGKVFNWFGATGDTLNDLYQKGLACNIHIWSRMIKTCEIDISTGNVVNDPSWEDDSSTSSLEGYRTNYK
jgi:hypothetical protein